MIKELLPKSWRKNPEPTYKMQAQELFDTKFYEGVKTYRDPAEQAGCDMAAFDMEVAIRKGYVDEFRANAQHFYRQHPDKLSDS
jgi:hypothetical protein